MCTRFLPRVLLRGMPYGSRTCLCLSLVRVPIRALISEPTIICVLRSILVRTKSNIEQIRLCFLSSQGKYTDIRAIEVYLPLMYLPRLSKEVNLSLMHIILPANLLLGLVVIRERDPAACHAW